MLQQQLQRKQKSFALPRGLYVLRYETSIDPANPPLVTVFCEIGRNEVILHPDQPLPTLSGPGQAMIIRANDTGSVKVEISSTAAMNTLDATLKFEPLRRDLAGEQAPAALAPAAPASFQSASPPGLGWGPGFASPPAPMPSFAQSAGPLGLQVIGHVARLGDVMAQPDDWIAGPSAPGRIEGVLLRWPNRPADVNLRYCAVVAGQQPGEARMAEIDEFSGTRGRARHLVSFAVELVGPGAPNYQLSLETLFLGSPARRATGHNLTATGPTGREPLVGLRLNVVRTNGSANYSPNSNQGALPSSGYYPQVSHFPGTPVAAQAQPVAQFAAQPLPPVPMQQSAPPPNVTSVQPTASKSMVQPTPPGPATSSAAGADGERRRIRVFKS